MSKLKLKITLLDGLFAVCDLSSRGMFEALVKTSDAVPGFLSFTMIDDELSVVCREEETKDGAKCEKSWRCFKVQGPLDFALTGVIASIATPLANAGISMFPIATFNTDYFLVKQENVAAAIDTLTSAGHTVES